MHPIGAETNTAAVLPFGFHPAIQPTGRESTFALMTTELPVSGRASSLDHNTNSQEATISFPPAISVSCYNHMDTRKRSAVEFPSKDDSLSVSSSDRETSSRPPSKRSVVGVKSASGWNLFVTGLPFDTTESQIAAAFTEQDWIRVNFDRRTGHCKGYAVVEYRDREKGQNAINQLHGTDFHGSRLGVHWAFVKRPGVPVAAKTSDETSS